MILKNKRRRNELKFNVDLSIFCFFIETKILSLSIYENYNILFKVKTVINLF